MQWALVRIIEEHLFVTKTEHEKKSLCISQKKKKKKSGGSVIFRTLFLQASKLFLCLREPY